MDLLVLPGHLCNSRLFAHTADALSDMARIQFADLYRASNVVEMARHALAPAPERFVLMANSMGGAVAFEVMRQAGQRVEALVLIGTTARPDTPLQNARRQQARELLERGEVAAVAQLYESAFFHPASTARDPALISTLETMIREAGYDGIVAQQHAFSSRPDSRETLASIACPTLVVCGREDSITPLDLSEEIAAGITGAELEIVEQCGHVPPMEWPEQTSNLVRHWLRGVVTRSAV